MDPPGDRDQPVPAAGGDPAAGPGALHAALTRFAGLYAAGRFFDAHEALETVWRRRPEDPVMVLLHGLIQWAVAFEHHRRGNAAGAVTLLDRAWSRLAEPGAEAGLGVDLTAVRAARPAARAALVAWRDGGPRPRLAPPPIAVGPPGPGAPPR